MKRSRLTDRLLVLCAVALLGSVALMPMRSLAGESATVRSAPTPLNSHHRLLDREPIARGDNRAGAAHRADSADRRDCSSPRQGHGRDACGGGTSNGDGASQTRLAAHLYSATTTSVSQPPAGTRVVPSSHGAPPLQGVSLPGTSVATAHPASPPASGQPASLPSASSAAQSIVNALLGPVPVLVPSVADTVSHAGGLLPWGWFIAFAVVDVLLMVAIIIRRRGSAPGVD